MFTNTYFTLESNRRFLTSRTRTPYIQSFYGDQDCHAANKNMINLNREPINECRGFISVDSSIPFTDYLRNLSESLNRSAKPSSQHSEANIFSTNFHLETKLNEFEGSSLENIRRHNFDNIDGEKMTYNMDKHRDTLSKVNKCDKNGLSTREEKSNRLASRYSFQDVLRDPCKDLPLPLSICYNHQYERFSRHVISTAMGHMSYYPTDYFHHQVDQGRCNVLQEGLGPHQQFSGNNIEVKVNRGLLDCHLSHLTQDIQQTIGDSFPGDALNVCYLKPGNLDITHQPVDPSPVIQHGEVSQTSDRPPQDITDRSLVHNVSKSQLVKKYKCEVCDKAFSRSNTLLTHKRIHTGDKPFICDICCRAFRQPGNLTRHRLTHSPYKPFVCPVCRKAFNRSSNLSTHVKTHSVYNIHNRHRPSTQMAPQPCLPPASWW